jgi:hypothetical protein
MSLIFVLFDFLSNGLLRLFVWFVVRDSECPDCQGMLHRVRSQTTHDLHRCQVCERVWVKRDGVFESYVSLKDPVEPHGAYLR